MHLNQSRILSKNSNICCSRQKFRQFFVWTRQKINTLYGCKCQNVSKFLEFKIYQEQAASHMNYLTNFIPIERNKKNNFKNHFRFRQDQFSHKQNPLAGWILLFSEFFTQSRMFYKISKVENESVWRSEILRNQSRMSKSRKRKCLKIWNSKKLRKACKENCEK